MNWDLDNLAKAAYEKYRTVNKKAPEWRKLNAYEMLGWREAVLEVMDFVTKAVSA